MLAHGDGGRAESQTDGERVLPSRPQQESQERGHCSGTSRHVTVAKLKLRQITVRRLPQSVACTWETASVILSPQHC